MWSDGGRGHYTADVIELLRQVSTATVWTQLYRRGFCNQYLHEVRPLRPDTRVVGRARTLRYLPARKDLLAELERDPQRNLQRVVIESIEPGDVLVIEARGETGAGVLGDFLAARVMARGGVGIVTDGAFRDTPEIVALGLAAYARGQHAGLSQSLHVPIAYDVPIACAGMTVLPGDMIVGDGGVWSSCRAISWKRWRSPQPSKKCSRPFCSNVSAMAHRFGEPIRRTRRPVVNSASGGANANELETHGLVRRATAASA
ncbi:MAG: hypothetical protein J7450_01030 [Thermomicrobium sp.]|nr:hypothetical protein [Thermomicrobium sp.]